MPTSSCVICDNCGKHGTMLDSPHLLTNPTATDWLPVGWFIYKSHNVENLASKIKYFCGVICAEAGWSRVIDRAGAAD